MGEPAASIQIAVAIHEQRLDLVIKAFPQGLPLDAIPHGDAVGGYPTRFRELTGGVQVAHVIQSQGPDAAIAAGAQG